VNRLERWMRNGGVALLLVGLAGCGETPPLPGEEVLAEMEVGYGKQAVLNSIPEGPGVDQASNMEHGYRVDRYFTGGRSVEVLWLRPESGESLVELGRTQVNPVIFVDQALDGWGWSHFDQRQADWDIADRTVAEEEPEPIELEYDDGPIDEG
jgi:hypothetical protein